MKYRKKPVVIEAEQFTEDLAIAMLVDKKPGPFGLSITSAEYHPTDRTVARASISIGTLKGTMTAQIGDWIIMGITGELYLCKPDIFEATYEEVR